MQPKSMMSGCALLFKEKKKSYKCGMLLISPASANAKISSTKNSNIHSFHPEVSEKLSSTQERPRAGTTNALS